MCEIVNTVKFTFNKEVVKPDIGEAVNFVKSLNADHGQVEAIYRMSEEKAIFVKWKSEEAMLHVLTFNSEDLIFHYADGKEESVYMSHAQDYILYVRVYGLPPEVPDRELVSVLGKYGKVKRVVREKIPVELNLDGYTGVRGVYMDVKKEIPTSLHFQNLKGNIYYSGNKDKCFLCKEEGHQMNSCPKRKARKQRGNRQQEKEQRGSSTSYADAVAGGSITGGTQTGDAQSEENQEIIEVLEEDVSESAVVPMAADISEDEARDEEPVNHPLYQLAVQGITELKKRMDEKRRQEEAEQRKKDQKEEAKIKSPPRKKFNCSLYKK